MPSSAIENTPAAPAVGNQSDSAPKKKPAPKKPATKAPTGGSVAPDRVDESVSAQDLPPNCACMLTAGCKGRIKCFSSRKVTIRDESGQPVKLVTEQSLRCSTCLRMPVNPRRIEQPLVNPRLFDRHRTKSRE